MEVPKNINLAAKKRAELKNKSNEFCVELDVYDLQSSDEIDTPLQEDLDELGITWKKTGKGFAEFTGSRDALVKLINTQWWDGFGDVETDEDLIERRNAITHCNDQSKAAKGTNIKTNKMGKEIYEDIYASPRKELVKKLVSKSAKNIIEIKSNGDSLNFSKNITKSKNKWYATISNENAKKLLSKTDFFTFTHLAEKNGEMLVFRSKMATEEMLKEKLKSIYDVGEKMAKNGANIKTNPLIKDWHSYIDNNTPNVSDDEFQQLINDTLVFSGYDSEDDEMGEVIADDINDAIGDHRVVNGNTTKAKQKNWITNYISNGIRTPKAKSGANIKTNKTQSEDLLNSWLKYVEVLYKDIDDGGDNSDEVFTKEWEKLVKKTCQHYNVNLNKSRMASNTDAEAYEYISDISGSILGGSDLSMGNINQTKKEIKRFIKDLDNGILIEHFEEYDFDESEIEEFKNRNKAAKGTNIKNNNMKNIYKISNLKELESYRKLNKNTEIYDADELGLPEVVMLRDNDKGVDYFFSIEEDGTLVFEEEQSPDKAKRGTNIKNNKMETNKGRSSWAKATDKMYAAIGAGERTSKKFATIRRTDGTSFKRKNANQYYPDGVPGGEDYTENRVNRTDKYGKDARKKIMETGGDVEMATGGGVGRSAWAKATDKQYAAIGAGERTSKKFATIRRTDGTSFKRKNANQYYPDGVPGGEDYTENRVNRTDKYGKDGRKKVMAKGGGLSKGANYVPNALINEIEVERNGKVTYIDGANILDGAYVKKGVKFEDGGGVGMNSDSDCCYSIGGL